MRHLSKIAFHIVSLSLTTCAAFQLPKPTEQLSAPKAAKTSTIKPNTAPKKPLLSGPVTASWIAAPGKVGTCSVENNLLSYAEDGIRKGIVLDLPVRGASAIVCSNDYTVIITPKDMVVSLGGPAILAGDEMLGDLSGRFVPANCYSLSIEEPMSEQIARISLMGQRFTITTKAGNNWSIALSDPVRWNIY